MILACRGEKRAQHDDQLFSIYQTLSVPFSGMDFQNTHTEMAMMRVALNGITTSSIYLPIQPVAQLQTPSEALEYRLAD